MLECGTQKDCSWLAILDQQIKKNPAGIELRYWVPEEAEVVAQAAPAKAAAPVKAAVPAPTPGEASADDSEVAAVGKAKANIPAVKAKAQLPAAKPKVAVAKPKAKKVPRTAQ